MNHQRLGVPHIGEVARQLKTVDDAQRDADIALDSKVQHAPERVFAQQTLCLHVVRVVGQSGVTYSCDLGVLLQPPVSRFECCHEGRERETLPCQGKRIVAVPLSAEAQRLKTLN